MLTKKNSLVDKTGNQINVLYPYRTKSGWAFDDEEVGLHKEPFVLGVPQIIDSIVGRKDEFTVYISASPIPKPTGHLLKVEPEIDDSVKDFDLSIKNGWYQLKGTDMIGWLCPATLKYFKDYPENIYFRIE